MDLFETKKIDPMLLNESAPFNDNNYIYELKLDGIRCIAYLDQNETVLRNKRNKDVTATYPELNNMFKCAKKRCIIDGELVSIVNGKPNFYNLQKRSLLTDSFKIKIASKRSPVSFVAYDIIYLDGNDITDKDLLLRKSLLEKNIKENASLSLSRYIDEKGIEFFNLAQKQGLEGIVAKKKGSKYYVGKKSKDWLKIKVMQDEDLIVCGYTISDSGGVKDLILGYYDKAMNLKSRGKIYLGVSKNNQQTVSNFAKANTVSTPHFPTTADRNIVWLKPELVGTAHYMNKTESGNMRQPVFKGLREDKLAKDCQGK